MQKSASSILMSMLVVDPVQTSNLAHRWCAECPKNFDLSGEDPSVRRPVGVHNTFGVSTDAGKCQRRHELVRTPLERINLQPCLPPID